MMNHDKVALVTGCSSGIGEATAIALAQAGYHVFATARDLSDLKDLKERAEASKLVLTTHRLDATDEQSIKGVISEIEKDEGRLDVLVNNAGYALMGSIEDLPMADIRKQFDVNVFGLLAISKAAIPLMRTTGGGTMVNISSVAGRIAVPLMGIYCSTKFAVEALSLATNSEVRQFGIRVVAIEPGPVATRFYENAMKASGHIILRKDGLYTDGYTKLRRMYDVDVPYGVDPERVARVILKAVRSRRPKTRYVVRARERLYAAAGSLVATRIGQRFIRRYFNLSSKSAK